MTAILGLSAFYHDSAAAIVVDGRIVAAAQEERFTRKKHDSGFPGHAVEYCLREAGLRFDQLDYVGFYEKPLLKFDRLVETYLAYAPLGFGSFARAVPAWLKGKANVARTIRKELGKGFRKRLIFVEHHESHAASAFFPSPFDEAAILTVDGVGEWATASYGTGRGNRIELSHELRFPHSLGLLYSAFTYFCGFRVNSGEYKLMGLAPYGEPRFVDVIFREIVDVKPDGSLQLNLKYFNYCAGLTMTSPRFDRLFGGPARKFDAPLTQREMDLAASIQAVTEEILLRMTRHLQKSTGQKNLCLAGGVALNCVANGRLLREGPFEDIWIQPAAGDSGGALGTALFIWHQLLGHSRPVEANDAQQGDLLGPRFSEDEIRQMLDRSGAAYRHVADEQALCEQIAGAIAGGKVVGWVQGRMEFGPRALGNRSILGDARSPAMQSQMNLKTKFRESFRPFAPVVLRERVSDYFELRDGQDSPYMLLVAKVREAHLKLAGRDEAGLQGLAKLSIPRSDIPAVTHVDDSARVQTVDPQRHGRFHKLLAEFERQTGCPVMINTSFNVRGEPIVCTPWDAYRCFLGTNIDVLVLERFVLSKEDQSAESQAEAARFLAAMPAD